MEKELNAGPDVANWNMDDSYIIDNLLCREASVGASGPHNTQGHGAAGGQAAAVFLPCLSTYWGSGSQPKTETAIQSPWSLLCWKHRSILPESARAAPNPDPLPSPKITA